MLHIQAAEDLLATASLEVGREQAPVAARQDRIGIELPTAVAEWFAGLDRPTSSIKPTELGLALGL
ncbi:hypothetical protein [Nonomuraea sp. NPDC049141]|uniref:hypothetical protein n=1 Tax=Nonomuraea sp. NPDC049141 TaxID=3155500 RepID=UPI0033DB2155